MNRVQIVEMRKGETRWKFIAHGAPYSREAADQIKTMEEARGGKIRFLPLAKGE